MKWISVNDRRPGYGDPVLVYLPRGERIYNTNDVHEIIAVRSLDYDGGDYWSDKVDTYGIEDTHWMPLPEPPHVG